MSSQTSPPPSSGKSSSVTAAPPAQSTPTGSSTRSPPDPCSTRPSPGSNTPQSTTATREGPFGFKKFYNKVQPYAHSIAGVLAAALAIITIYSIFAGLDYSDTASIQGRESLTQGEENLDYADYNARMQQWQADNFYRDYCQTAFTGSITTPAPCRTALATPMTPPPTMPRRKSATGAHLVKRQLHNIADRTALFFERHPLIRITLEMAMLWVQILGQGFSQVMVQLFVHTYFVKTRPRSEPIRNQVAIWALIVVSTGCARSLQWSAGVLTPTEPAISPLTASWATSGFVTFAGFVLLAGLNLAHERVIHRVDVMSIIFAFVWIAITEHEVPLVAFVVGALALVAILLYVLSQET